MASKTNPITFFQQVRAETVKVTWPSRRETHISTAMVMVMAFFAATFLFAADQLMGWLIGLGLERRQLKSGLGDEHDRALVYRSRLFEF